MSFSADLIANASAEKNRDFEAQKAAMKARLHANNYGGDDMHGDNQFGPPMAMQNTPPYAQQLHNPQAIANVLKQGPSLASSSLGSLNNPSISPSLQQKIIQQSLLNQQQQLPGQNLAQGQPIRGAQLSSQPVQQQQQMVQQQQLVQQLRLAVQAGLISPQTLNQPFSPQMLNILQQMLQSQAVLQRLNAQHQMITQSKTNVNPMTQRQQLEQVTLMSKKIKQQILQLQQQLAQSQQQQQQQVFNRSSSTPGVKDDLSNDYSNLSIKESTPPTSVPQSSLPQSQAQAQPPVTSVQTSQPQSRLNQWKLPSPDKDTATSDAASTNGDTLNKAVGSKPLTHSHSSSNLQSQQGQSKFEFTRSLSIGGDSTWSSIGATSSSDWPTSTITTSSVSSNSHGTDPSLTTASSDKSESLSNDHTASPSGEHDPNRSTPGSNSSASTTTFSLNDMIPEFIPGKPWQGVANKNIDDDPHITPGSVSRSLSVNTIKDEYLNNLTNKAMAVTSSMDITSSVPSPNAAAWSTLPRSVNPPQPKWSSSASMPTPPTSELWGASMPNKANTTRPPPGLTNPKLPWGNSGQQFNRGISWAGDKSAFTAGELPN